MLLFGCPSRSPQVPDAQPGPDATPVDAAFGTPTLLDVDVLVGPMGTVIYPREPNRPCICGEAEFPARGGCAYMSDVPSCRCDPYPGSCLSEIRVDQAGQVVGTSSLERLRYGAAYTSSGDPNLAAQTELVFIGCGGVARVPISRPAFEPPELTQLSLSPTQLRATWPPTTAGEQSILHVTEGFGSAWCHAPTPGDSAVPEAYFYYDARVMPYRVSAPEVHQTPLGEIRVWRAVSNTYRVYMPRMVAETTFELTNAQLPGFDSQPPQVTISVDGDTTTGPMDVETATIDLASGQPLLLLRGSVNGNLTYTAGATTDTLNLYYHHPYRAEFPHVQPQFTWGVPGDSRLELDLGPLTMTSAVNPSVTIEASVSLTWRLPMMPELTADP